MGIKSEVLKTLLKKPATKKYPFETLETAPDFMGTIAFDVNICTGCSLCGNLCPAEAIKLGRKKKKIKVGNIIHQHLIHPIKSVDMGKCIRCGLCVEVCPVKCIWFTNEFELAEKDKEKLTIK